MHAIVVFDPLLQRGTQVHRVAALEGHGEKHGLEVGWHESKEATRGGTRWGSARERREGLSPN